MILFAAVVTASLSLATDGVFLDAALIGLAGSLYVFLSALSDPVRRPEPGGRIAITAGDVALITVVIWATGGVNSEYYILYYLPIIVAALRQEMKSGLAGCVLAPAAYAVAAVWAPRSEGVLPFGPFRVLTVALSALVLLLFFSLLSRESKLCSDLRDTLHHSLRRVAAVYDVAHAANTGADLAGVLSIILDHAARATGAANGSVFLVVEDQLRPMASLTMPASDTEPPSTLPIEPAQRALSSRSPITASTTAEGGDQAGGETDVVYVPLLTVAGPIGVLSLVAGRNRKFARRHLDFLVSLCSEAAIAIENAQLRSELRRMAVTDHLTGLANRREFDRRLMVELQRAGRYGHTLSLLMIDVDDLKRVNDTFGHATGDEVLRALARMLKNSLRSSEVAGRVGGDEFAVVLPETDGRQALDAAERLIARFPEALRSWPAMVETETIVSTVGMSVGVAGCQGGLIAAKDLSAMADTALYEAKRLGKNRACASSSSPALWESDAAATARTPSRRPAPRPL